MIRIPQHGKDNELFDINRFLEDIDQYLSIDTWLIKIEWCQGEGSEKIEKISEQGTELGNLEFRELYKGIFQTIDGYFQLKSAGESVAEFLAIDSSYWEVNSNSEVFMSHMLKKYGEYGCGNA